MNTLQDYKHINFPTTKNEEWKYTSFKEVLALDFNLKSNSLLQLNDLKLDFLHQKNDFFLIFINGEYQENISNVNSKSFTIYRNNLEEFSKNKHLFEKYKTYNQDGFLEISDTQTSNQVFIKILPNQIVENPIYIYYFNDSTVGNSFVNPQISVLVGENSEAIFVENFSKKGNNISFTNSIIEFVLNENSNINYYKILNEGNETNHVGTTQVNQNGKSVFSSTTLVLTGNIIRNNLNISLNKEYCETHLFGLSLLTDETHVDNHTVVDHAKPNCESNELYKAILDKKSSSVFNGKIFVRQDAQKTNAYQSSKNILLSNDASANSKPQLEIWADDVKCSHGHATGQLNKEHVFYLKSRGIGEKDAMKMLTQAYAQDILNSIKIESLKQYCENEITKRFLL